MISKCIMLTMHINCDASSNHKLLHEMFYSILCVFPGKNII